MRIHISLYIRNMHVSKPCMHTQKQCVQCVAVCCGVIITTYMHALAFFKCVMQCVLQCVAVCCSVLQWRCHDIQASPILQMHTCSVLQCAAMCRNDVITTYRNAQVLKCADAVCDSVLQ